MKPVSHHDAWLFVFGLALIGMSAGLGAFRDVMFGRFAGHLCDLGVGAIIGYYWRCQDDGRRT